MKVVLSEALVALARVITPEDLVALAQLVAAVQNEAFFARQLRADGRLRGRAIRGRRGTRERRPRGSRDILA